MKAMPFVSELFKSAGYTVSEEIRVSCGWPHKGGTGTKKRVLGQCWDKTASTDSQWQIFISPTMDDPSRVLDILIHEVVHTVVGIKAGHKKPFSDCAKAVGLVKPWTMTTAGDDLKALLVEWIAKIGPYPHGALKPGAVIKKAEPTRCLLMQCGSCECKIRTTQKWLDTYGDQWPCPCGDQLISEAGAEEGDS